nr:hypothetical protein PHYPA_004031 [Physcomitrium patens]
MGFAMESTIDAGSAMAGSATAMESIVAGSIVAVVGFAIAVELPANARSAVAGSVATVASICVF